MEPIGISLIVIYIVAIALGIWLLKKVGKIILLVLLLTILFFGAIGFFVYKDIADIKANAKEGLMVVFVDNGKVLAGFAVEGEPNFFTAEELSVLTSQYQQKQYAAMLGDRFKLFMIDSKMIEGLKDEPINSLQDSDDEALIPASLALEALRSKNPMDTISQKVPSAKMEGATPSEIKGYLLASIFTRHLIQSPPNLVDQMKKDNINVYPETAVFRALQYVPTSLVRSIAQGAMEKGGEAKDMVSDKIASS